MRTHPRFIVVLALTAMTMLGCAGETDPDTTPGPATPAAQDDQDDLQQKSLEFTDSSLGQILTIDGEMTLYVFMRDESGVSNCVDSCAETWPPLEVGDGVASGAGVDRDKVGSLTHPSGVEQVSYDGRPLYTYAADTQPGDTNGQGVGGNWFVIGTDGQPIQDGP